MTAHKLLTTLGLIGALGSTAISAGSSHKYSGAILSATESQLVLKVGTESLTFKMNKETSLTLNGKTVKPGELKMDDAADVSAEKSTDEGKIAITVAATRKTLKPVAFAR